MIRVTAPSRLHFGLLSLGGVGRRFGGVGVMVQRPAVQLQVTRANQLRARGPLAHRAVEFAEHWSRYHGLSAPPAVSLNILEAPRQHVGLGVGTQLGLAIATALSTISGHRHAAPAELARSVGRGTRSAVGSYGFALGGLIAERGKLPGEMLAPLAERIELPEVWQFVIICPRATTGLAGEEEGRFFEQPAPVSAEVPEQLQQRLFGTLLPAAAAGEFERFAESTFEFSRMAGTAFVAQQGGIYHPAIAPLIDWARQQGVRGVGQSSWGPTMFAILPDTEQAQEFAALVRRNFGHHPADIWISGTANRGATVELV